MFIYIIHTHTYIPKLKTRESCQAKKSLTKLLVVLFLKLRDMADHHHFLQSLKQSFSLAELDPIILDHSMNHFPGLNPGIGLSGLNSHNFMGFPTDSIFPQLPDCAGTLESLPGLFIRPDSNIVDPVLDPVVSRKRKGVMDISTSESSPANSSAYSSPQVSNNGNHGSKTRAGRGKKVKVEEEKPREVIHVRAKRGQATDSHSLAERVRRGKINERLRCLQDIVPGCYKTMGMAVMLDEIINYVQSLQNQVEFLSMKLTAASTYYDFNSDTDAIETIQRAKAFGAIKTENDASSQGLPPSPFGPNFGCYPQLPHTS